MKDNICNFLRLTIPGLLMTTILSNTVLSSDAETISYDVNFFAAYNPVTALDIVERVPGFKLQRRDGPGEQEKVRGFGNNASDVLINGKRPSTKSTPIEKILARYSADSVVRVDLIRGATGGLESSQSSVVVNVILKARDGRGSIPWDASLSFEDGNVTPGGNITYVGNRNNTDFSIGIELEEFDYEYGGPEILTSSIGPDEYRDESVFENPKKVTGTADLEHHLLSGDSFRLNMQLVSGEFSQGEDSVRLPEGANDPDLVQQRNLDDATEVELGGDYERMLSGSLRLKAIGLVTRKTSDFSSTLTHIPFQGATEVSDFSYESEEGESIARLELNWSGWQSHIMQFGVEIVENFLDSESILIFDDGQGPVGIPLPGGNARVEELRGEFSITDSWTLSDRLTLDFGLAFEISEIEQSGDTEQVRDFSYAKPSIAATFSPTAITQWRFKLKREVGQLDFFDFVSSANFEDGDGDLNLGNPNLKPEQTWVLEIGFEHRFDKIGVFEFTPFYHVIDDVEDLLPISDMYAAPGNIGDGERWGFSTSLTTSLDFIKIKNGRLDASYAWQDSSVTDPVTGDDRALSGEAPWQYEIALRKDVPSVKLSYGLNYTENDVETLYGLDDIVIETYVPGLSAFLEKTFGSYKIRFNAFNLLSQGAHRQRQVYDTSRESNVILFTESRVSDDDPYFQLVASGTF
ncbi:MAG: TonB-dependent receptor [Pseudomonadales bacterium]